MAVSSEIQEQRTYEETREQSRRDFEESQAQDRRNQELALENKRAKLESIRLAKETLLENSKSKAVDERDISASDIVTFATTLQNYINS